MVTFILYYTLSSIMILSKIGVIGVKNQDNSSYSDFVLNQLIFSPHLGNRLHIWEKERHFTKMVSTWSSEIEL